MSYRNVWTMAEVDDIYEPRCSFCGKYRRRLMFHWFFTGLYCINCIHEVLYDDARSLNDIMKKKKYFNPNDYDGEVK